MKKNIFLLFVTALLLSGCYKNNKYQVTKPANLIPEKKLASIIREMDIVQGIVSYNRTHNIHDPRIEEKYYDILFKHYDVTSEQVRQSIGYYISNGKDMEKIYDRVLMQFSIDQSRLSEEQSIQENASLDSTGVYKFQFKIHWMYGADSVLPYSFKPDF